MKSIFLINFDKIIRPRKALRRAFRCLRLSLFGVASTFWVSFLKLNLAFCTLSICFKRLRDRFSIPSSVISSSLNTTSSRTVLSPSRKRSPMSKISMATVGVREMDLITESFPRSIRLAIATSPSRFNNGTVPISRRYIRTGSFVFSNVPGVKSSPCPAPSSRSTPLSSLYALSVSTISIPALPKALNSSSSSSEEVTSDGNISFTSSYRR